jgi:hypothetical protein
MAGVAPHAGARDLGQSTNMPRAYLIPIFAVALAIPLLGVAQENDHGAQLPDPSLAARNAASAGAKSCDARSVMLNFPIYRDGEVVRQAPVWRLGDGAYFFAAGMTIDADGSPNAYNPENTGLDDNANAGQPGHWDGVLQDRDGNPLVQGPDDPFPGYYISCTSLADRMKPPLDPTRFVDASKIPYVVLPREIAFASGTRLGDFAVVMNMRTGAWSSAIFADIGTFGEGSIALADSLGISSDARRGGTWGGVFYLVFPGSGSGQPRSIDEINEAAGKALQDWGGTEQLNSCAASARPAAWPWYR